jgi:hypothetical protein
MLREPVVRLLSSYYFILRRPLHPMHRKLKKERLGVEDYIRLTPRRQNLQCDSSPESAMVKLAMSAHCTLQKKIFRDHLVWLGCARAIRRYSAIPAAFFFWKEVRTNVELQRNTNGTRNDFEIRLLLGAIPFWAVALPVAFFFFLTAGALQERSSTHLAFPIRV